MYTVMTDNIINITGSDILYARYRDVLFTDIK